MTAKLPVIALAALTIACNAGPGATPPGASPVTTPPSASPSSAPTDTPAPTVTPLPSPSFGADQIEHPTGSTDIVLRMEVGGGFVPMGAMLTDAPTFTLYGDGTVIFRPMDSRGLLFGEDAMLPWLVGHLDEEEVQALLNFALTTGRLATARERYDDGTIADAPTTIFTLNAGGVSKTVSVYALAEMEQPGPDSADRRAFAELAEILRTFENQEELDTVEPYDAEMYRLVLLEGFGQPAVEPIEWPWDDLSPADFAHGDEPGGIANLDREHVARLLDVPNGGHAGIWVNDPDGEPVQFAVRPLLPEEIAVVEAVSP